MGSQVDKRLVTEAYRGADGALVINETPFPIEQVLSSIEGDGSFENQIRAALQPWGETSGTAGGRPQRIGGLFDRNRYLTPETPFGQMKTARDALNDDVVGGAADLSESLSLASLSVQVSRDLDEQDVLNQWAGDVDLDTLFRQMWQGLFAESQITIGSWWARKTYTVRSETPSGLKSTKKYDLRVPTAFTLLDNTKIVPVGSLLFGREHLAYAAEQGEAAVFRKILDATPTGHAGWGSNSEPSTAPLLDEDIIKRLVRREYHPDPDEQARLAAYGCPTQNLFLLDQRFVWRHTLTKPHYEPFARVRLASTFEILDQKAQLRQQDRAMLIAGTNFIVLIRIGDKDHPGTAAETSALRAGVKKLGSVPVITGDQRLNVDIVTPTQDFTLQAGRYDTVDHRLAARVFGTFLPTGEGQDDPLKMGRLVGASFESRRHMLKRAFEANVLKPIVESNDRLREKAKIRFDPGRIALSFDQAYASFMLDLREAREISRETILGQFGFDQADEAVFRELEAELYDDTFGTIVPHGVNPGDDTEGEVPSRLARRSGGRRGGGTRNGGGAAPGSGQGEPSRDPRRSRETVAAELKAMSRDELIDVAGNLDEPLPRRHRLRVEQLKEGIMASLEFDDEVED